MRVTCGNDPWVSKSVLHLASYIHAGQILAWIGFGESSLFCLNHDLRKRPIVCAKCIEQVRKSS